MKIKLTDPNGITPYTNAYGRFIQINRQNVIRESFTCREQFESSWQYQKIKNRVGFSTTKNLKLMKLFWNKIFRKLGEQSRFRIHRSNFDKLYIIDLPVFWTKNSTVRNLFTLLLRGSLYSHEGDTIKSTLKRYSLANDVLDAIEWFLKGNTEPTYRSLYTDFDNGFVDKFVDLTQEKIAKYLVKPNRMAGLAVFPTLGIVE